MTNFIRTNSFTIIGTLRDVMVEKNVTSTGKNKVSGTANIYSIFEGNQKIIPIIFSAFEFSTKTDEKGNPKPNKTYLTFCGIREALEGRKVRVYGGIEESLFKGRDGNIVSAMKLRASSITGVESSMEDSAFYVLDGFVTGGITDKTNKAGEVYRKDFTIGQINYKDDNMSLFTVQVPLTDNALIKGLESVKVGTSVHVEGVLDFTEKEMVLEPKVSFGKAIPKKVINKSHLFRIGGVTVYDPTLSNEEDGRNGDCYDSDTIKELVAAYKAHVAEISEATPAAKNSPVEPTKEPAPSYRQSSLI